MSRRHQIAPRCRGKGSPGGRIDSSGRRNESRRDGIDARYGQKEPRRRQIRSRLVRIASPRDAVNRAQAYELEYTLDPNAGPWTDGGTFASTRGIGITGLTRGKDYWARIRAVGPNGAGAWSDPATILVA